MATTRKDGRSKPAVKAKAVHQRMLAVLLTLDTLQGQLRELLDSDAAGVDLDDFAGLATTIDVYASTILGSTALPVEVSRSYYEASGQAARDRAVMVA